MIQLVAFAQSGSVQHELDTPKRPIELNFQYTDLKDPMSRRSPYSFRFPMPLTNVNSKFFSFFYNANVAEGTFDAMTKTDCTLYVDGVMVMQGVLQLHSVSSKGYDVNILEQVADVFDFIKELTWSQLFITAAGTLDTDLDHALSWDNVTDSWVTTNDITTGAVGAGTIVYPLSDCAQQGGSNSTLYTEFGFHYDISSSTLLGIGMQSGNLSVLNFKPAIRISYLIRYIFERAGYAVDSTFLDSADTQKMYMFLATESERVQGRVNYGFLVGLTTEFTIQIAQASIMMSLAFTQESVAPFFDPDGLITGGAFVAPYDGTFELTTRVVVSAPSVSPANAYTLTTQLTVNGESTVPNQATGGLLYGETHIVDNEFELTLNAGDTVACYVATTNSLADVTIHLTGASTATYFKLINYTTTSTFVDVSENFPDVSVAEWFKAIVQRFNLVMISDLQSPKVVQIEPWTDWWSASTVNKDWTEIVDQDSIKIEPTIAFQKKKYEFTDAKGEDHQNKYWEWQFGWIKGRYTFLNENDFVTDEEKTLEVFQPYRNRPIFQTTNNATGTSVPNVLVPIFWDWDADSDSSYAKKWVACKPVLAYYNGLQDIGNGGSFEFGVGNAYTTYPYFSEFNEVGVSLTTKSLAWGYDHPSYFDAPFISGGTTGGTTLRYAFYEYWSKMFNEIYSSEARVMTCKINLNYTELYDLKFNDNLYLDGCFWRVLSIDNFQVGGNGLANAKLIKVIAKPIGRESVNCGARPSTFNTDGTVNFVSISTGAPVSVTEPCCTLHGYVWDNDNNQCFSRTAGGGHGGGGVGTGDDGTLGGAGGGGNGGGGVGGETTEKDFAAEVPNPYVSFPLAKITTFQQGGVIGANIKTNLFQTTTGATPAKASTSAGLTDWNIPLDSIVYVKISAVAVEVSGSAATIGESVTQNVQATVANTRTGARAQIVARDVGTTTVIAENKDAGASGTISVDAYQARAGDASSFSLTCTGATNINMAWFIDMELTTIQIAGSSDTLARAIVYNLDPNIVEYGNLSPNTILDWNLPLL